MQLALNQTDMAVMQVRAFFGRNQKAVLMIVVLLALAIMSAVAVAGTPADTWAAGAYTFIRNMATGNVIRGACIVGGLLGTLAAAVNGKPILALTGVGLAIFGFLSPTMINAVFGTALI